MLIATNSVANDHMQATRIVRKQETAVPIHSLGNGQKPPRAIAPGKIGEHVSDMTQRLESAADWHMIDVSQLILQRLYGAPCTISHKRIKYAKMCPKLADYVRVTRVRIRAAHLPPVVQEPISLNLYNARLVPANEPNSRQRRRFRNGQLHACRIVKMLNGGRQRSDLLTCRILRPNSVPQHAKVRRQHPLQRTKLNAANDFDHRWVSVFRQFC